MIKTKFEEWTNKHPFAWCSICFGLGVFISIVQNVLYNAPLKRFVGISFLYGGMLVIVALTTNDE